MTISQTIGNDLCQKLRIVGLTKEETLPIVNLITKQVAAEGPENVVARLKILKQAGVDVLAGNMPKFHWIAHTPKAPKGPWKPVFQKLYSSSYKHRKRALNALMVYAHLCLPRRAAPTAVQERKFIGSVVHTPDAVSLREKGIKSVRSSSDWIRVIRWMGIHLKESRCDLRLGEAPDAIGYILRKKGDDRTGVAYAERQVNAFLGSDAGRPFHCFPEVLQSLGDVGQDYFELVHPWHNAYGDYKESLPPVEPVGVIGSTQEPGFKFRAFASPNLILQAALEPLKNTLLRCVRHFPSDCTFDQMKGVLGVQTWLQSGDTVYAVDLSDATNNFPLALQLELLRSIGIADSSVTLLDLVSRSPYRKVWGDRANVSWNVGQPLGAGPSFPAFALAHTAVALLAGMRAGLQPWEALRHFYVLGDDFVTNHGGLHSEYRQILDLLHCPISEQKCLVSTSASEFAGKLITQHHVYHGYKYRAMSDQSFLDVVRTLGKQSISPALLSADQYATCRLLYDIPEPYGLGFNPKGIPLSVRYYKYLVLKDELEVDKPDPILVSLDELRNKFAYQVKSRHWRYLDADPGVRVETTRTIRLPNDVSAEDVFRSVRGEEASSLVPRFVPQGDPRPNRVLHRSRRLAEIFSRIPEITPNKDDSSVLTSVDAGDQALVKPESESSLDDDDEPSAFPRY